MVSYIEMKRRITGFIQDAEAVWKAYLECGHTIHIRHNPPWSNRPWVTTREGRAKFLGSSLNCTQCDKHMRNDQEEI